MHQTFYIDIDEEITSIVDRLRKAKAKEVVIVVPKRALLIQSVVNLKLLKKESESLKKQLIIVTQDKLGKLLVEKTGIAVQQKLDEVESEEIVNVGSGENQRADVGIISKGDGYGNVDSKNRLENMGSSEYFDEPPRGKKTEQTVADQKYDGAQKKISVSGVGANVLPSRPGEERLVNKELVTDISNDIQRGARKQKASSLDIVKNMNIQQSVSSDFPSSVGQNSQSGADFSSQPEVRKVAGKTPDQPKKKNRLSFEQDNLTETPSAKVRDPFSHDNLSKYAPGNIRHDYAEADLSGKFWKYFAAFGLVIAAIGALAAAYLFLPKADIKIFVKTSSQAVDAQVTGDINQAAIDQGKQAIPAKVVSQDDQLTDTITVTGSASSAGQKAHGTITIYNEFSASPQALVATTRFQTADGKIFRLVKGVSVPGFTVSGGQTNPGAIEADVVADAAGSDYNIDPASFTIPGFKDSGNDKYTKIYAKSFKAMSGGGTSGGGTGGKAISASDISNAKDKTLADLTQALKQKLKNSLSSSQTMLDDAFSISNATYSASNSEGEVVSSFTMTVKATASAIVFDEGDLRDVLSKDVTSAGGGTDQFDTKSLTLQYGKADADFKNGTITIRVNAAGKINPNIDLDNLKKGILGKSEADFMAYLKTYPAVERAEISYWPAFISGKIPAYASRVNIELDNS